MGYGPWGHEESDPTERLSAHAHRAHLASAPWLPSTGSGLSRRGTLAPRLLGASGAVQMVSASPGV